jgi:DNA-binding winged helix-turn-helix (wHTH) protein
MGRQRLLRSVAGVTTRPSSDRAAAPSVQLLRWPAQSAQRDLATPCLWLLPPGELPPVPGPSDDWVRLPADERDVAARAQRLAARAGSEGLARVTVDPHGRVDRAGRRAELPPLEAALFRVLLDRAGRVASRAELGIAAWGVETSGRALDGRIHALRGHLRPLDLVIHTIRGRGFLLAGAETERVAEQGVEGAAPSPGRGASDRRPRVPGPRTMP